MNLIKFKRDTTFRKQFFVPDSFAHPAKMDAQLLIWIVEKFTNPGETILDCMAGSGTTMLACQLGRNAILVELEKKFCMMMEGGDCDGFECALCGQRMEWECIENEEQFLLLADKTFPNDRQLQNAFQRYGWEWTRNQILKRFPAGPHHIIGNWEQVKQRPQFEQLGGKLGTCQILQGDARNLEGLLVDKCVFSPPYGNPRDTSEEYDDKYDLRRPKGVAWGRESFRGRYGEEQGQIGNLPYGSIDSVITSPPYSDEPTASKKYLQIRFETNRDITKPSQRYAKYSQVDRIITSPPYEGIEKSGKSGIDWTKKKDKQKTMAARISTIENVASGYTASGDNIGNLKGDTYLEAMALVYSQCFVVLRDNGLLILITKNFIREKKEVRLDLDTIKLCETAGFTFQERWYRELPAQSFWRTIYKQKYPEAPELKYEDVLVFVK